jgi:hypothetical protein
VLAERFEVLHRIVARHHPARDRLVLFASSAIFCSMAARSSGVNGRLYEKS